MGIQSTREITREHAIERIKQVSELCLANDALELHEIVNEPDFTTKGMRMFMKDVLNGVYDVDFPETLLNDELEDILDQPFFRRSIFDNYTVVG